jgi:pSer/pThr/pTyr-binding forkhead associated (FHA) protein
MPVHSVTLGVAPECDLRVVDDPWVSGFHARLTRDEQGRFWIEDMGSMNGTWIQRAGTPRPPYPAMLPRVWQRRELRAGDTVWLSRKTAFTWHGGTKFSVAE